MRIIVGLGNPGAEYAKTRHNVGFMVLDKLLEQHAQNSVPAFTSAPKLHLEMSKPSSDLILAKPQTYMNESGQAVRALLDYYKVSPDVWSESLYVVHDDLDIELGEYKIQLGKGPKVHNGLLSIYATLGTHQFWHVRVGVDSRHGQRFQSGRDYVLEPFSSEEKTVLEPTITNIIQELQGRAS